MGTTPVYLADREAQLRRFAAFLDDFPGLPHNVRVTGLHGVGKTVLLAEYARLAAQRGWIAVTHECADSESDAPVAIAALHRRLQDAVERLSLGRRVERVAGEAFGRALDLIGRIRLEYEGVAVSVGDRPKEVSVDPAVEERVEVAMEGLGEATLRSGAPGVALLFDEFQVWRDRKTRREYPLTALARAIAAVQRRRGRAYPIMLVVAGLDSLIDHLAAARSYTERMFEPERLGNLPRAQALRAFIEPAQAAGGRVQPEVAEHVATVSAGYPYFIQFFGAHLWRMAGGRGRPLTMALWRQEEAEMLATLDALFFDARYARATPAERGFLHLIAQVGTEATVEQLIGRGAGDNSRIQPKIASLAAKGLVYRPARGRIAFATPLFADYLRRRVDV